ncbi:calcium-activated chloride channel regulator 1-like [Pollicipes pollicipes]|uniref:calcium-activated chloride channel regulator 1-like n=1 Tax=Pollicipes pollicipes TaxID=41117 RepID=UPI001884B1BA|nr:calcium-activated chloride channel regulator 1-like [Pollicipes pollicipes]
MFYYTREANGESKVVPNTCSNTDLRGYKMDQKTQQPCTYSKTTGLPDNNCVFYPYGDNDAISSLMAFTYLDSVNHFCNNSDDKRHRPDAPNKQNFRCSQRSVWEVMRENADFKGGRNPPASLEPNQLVPTFEVVRPAQARFIMVLDTSGSMGDVSAASSRQTSKIQKLHSAATKWIKYELQNGTWVSIVTFTDTAVLQTEFKQIVDKTSREEIARHVPSSAGGGTCICNGVYLGLKTLKKAVGTGGVMVLMTDGGENPPCYNPDTKAMWDLTDLYDPVVAADVRVITMAFGTSADSRLEKFADISGGRTYFISETKASLQLDQAFQGCLTYQPDITVETEKNIVLFQQYFSGFSVTTFSSMFSIDPTTGRDVVFKLAFDDASAISTVKSVRLVSPTGATYTNVSYEPSENFGTLKLHLAEEGDWQFLRGFQGRSDDVVITVTSKSR